MNEDMGSSLVKKAKDADMNEALEESDDADDTLLNARDKALIPGVILQVSDHLEFRDTISMRLVCKQWKQIVPAVKGTIISDWNEAVGGNLRPVNHTMSVLNQPIKVHGDLQYIYVKCTWKDQGWGNHKSRLFLYIHLEQEGRRAKGDDPQSIWVDLFELASHEWKTVERMFESTSPLVQNAVEGTHIQITAKNCGLGGGHSIHIQDMIIIAKEQ